MSEKFTPGPWKWELSPSWKTEPDKETAIYIKTRREKIIALLANVDDQNFHGAESLANANLIAAAPDMYKALERACDKYCIGWTADSFVNCEDCIILKALRKARGEEE
jgi:hypothetical protein